MMYYKKIYQYVCCLCAFFLLAACGGGSSEENLSSTGVNSVTQGVAVDPYVVGAVFQEVAADGSTVLQRQSTPSDENGVFTFPDPLTVGSTIEMKISNKGKHGGAPFQGMLRRSVNGDDRLSVVVTPLTTLLANGIPAEDVLQALSSCGFTGLTVANLYADPMQGLTNLTGGIIDRDLRTLQAAMAVEAFMEITGNFKVTVNDLYDSDILKSTAGAMQMMLNAAEFSKIKTALADDPEVTVQPILGEFIMTVLQQQQSLIGLVKKDLALSGIDQAFVGQTAQDAMGGAVAKVKTQCLARQPQPAPPTDPTTPPDGVALYNSDCSSCHGPLNSTNKPGRTATQIQTAIDNNVGSMGYLNPLTAVEIQAIADAMSSGPTPVPPTEPTTPPTDPTSPPDGVALYNSDCSSCHGPLNSTNKPGRTATDIQVAIDNNVGSMGYLSNLTAAEIQAIADALPAAPPTNPTTPPDGTALYNSECAGCHGSVNATNKPGRTAAQVQTAIDNNIGNMGYLNTLTVDEVQAIADVLPVAPPPPVTPPDGPTLYIDNCAGCHNSLAATNKPGRTSADIQVAIDNNIGSMGYLNTLTAVEVQAIADVLPPATNPGPDYSDCTACHGQPPSGNSFPDTAGSHAVHTALPSVNCGTCHVDAAHNDQLDMGFPSNFNAMSGPATANADGTCSNISCHGGQTTPELKWETGSIAVDTQCTSCHESGTGQYNSYNSGRHSKHSKVSCTDCHNTDKLQTGHFSDLATSGFQDPAATIGGSTTSVGLYEAGSCSNLTSGCHNPKSW